MNGTSSIPLLLHTCCGPCASGSLPRLSDRETVLYFSNSNLSSKSEYEKRLAAAEKLAQAYQIELLADPYDHDAWLAHIHQLENAETYPEKGLRCRYCFEFSLTRTAQKAEELGMNFATSLTVSPHKNSKLIFEIGSRFSHFEPWDFKKQNGFMLSTEESKRLELYRQNYCGCEFSIRKEQGAKEV